MVRWFAGLAAALLLPACGDGSAPVPADVDVDGRNPTAAPQDLGSGQPPFIRIVSPGSRTTCQEGATITLQAVAADPNALIARVNFFDGNRLIGGKSSAPYFTAYGGLDAGTHVLTAVAVDVEGITSVSPPVTVFVVRRVAVEEDGDDD